MWAGVCVNGFIKKVEPVERFFLVLDSSAIQRDLPWLAKCSSPSSSLRTAIMETMDAGVVIGLVPPEALTEIEKFLPSIASDCARDLVAVTNVWKAYRDRLTVLPPTRAHRNHELEDRDVLDMPFVAVLRESGAHAIVTADRDLLDTVEDTISPAEIMMLLREYARQKAISVGSAGQMHVGAMAAGYGGSLLGRGVREALTAFRRLPPWAQLGMFIGGLWAIDRPEVKTWFAKRKDEVSRFAGAAVPKLLEVAASGNTAETAATAVSTTINARIGRRRRLGLRAALLRVLADQRTGVAVNELAKRVIAAGYETTARRFATYVDGYLRRDPMFELDAIGWRIIRARCDK